MRNTNIRANYGITIIYIRRCTMNSHQKKKILVLNYLEFVPKKYENADQDESIEAVLFVFVRKYLNDQRPQ